MKKSLSSVSIQTVPVMAALNNGEIATISRAVNGGTRLHQVENMLETDTLGKTKQGASLDWRNINATGNSLRVHFNESDVK